MLRSNPPSLRNFAVLKLERRTALGRFYSVRDRRLEAVDQLLFVPSKLRAWPRHLAQLSNLDSTPVRLRDGRVALLIGSSFDLTTTQSALKVTKQSRVNFDAMSGFQHGSIKSRKPLLIGTFCSGLVCLLFLPQTFANSEVRPKEVLVKVEPKRYVCSTLPREGDQVELLANRVAKLNGVKYRIESRTQLGGLAQISLVRACDKSKWKVTAWKTGKVYQIDSIG
jgi:hypothetical protein